ncbi:acyltransferase-like protein At1g54570, chloroplastic isoform X2 [Phoenix dactylifera]|uniref:Acyltransferase-like protein At1g54570, chloroplastic isoform X2 n=1 Tax=Phoenix dactylifera TaxID=42345 RepID=A0A8B9AR72_PHODC|nr:acyltransferase-like protein At1g54570, chloroplastic isoform X2 [Phoenix dactylifera]
MVGSRLLPVTNSARAQMASATTFSAPANAPRRRSPPPPPHLPRFHAFSRNLRPAPAAVTSKMEPAPAITDRQGTAGGPPEVAGAVPKLLDESEIEPRGVRDYIDWSRDLVRPDGGPPRWFSPLECGSREKGSPLLLFLPGIDGVGLGLIRHHQRLGKVFDIWCLHIPVMDRTPFEGLVDFVERTVKSEKSCSPNKPIYLVGESIGACIALAVAARNPNIDLILILANPATSFCKSQLHSLSVFLDVVPEPLHINIPYFLNFITGNHMRMSSTYAKSVLSLQKAAWGLSESLADIPPCLSFLVNILPKESLLWKLKMLRSASFYVNSRLHAVKAQALILASGRDQLFPSREEAERLCSALPNCRIRHFKDGGHNIFLEGGIDLLTTIRGAGYFRRSSQLDYVSDYLLLTPDEFQKATEQYRWIDLAMSPVMLSTLEDGRVVKGLAGIPLEGPAVLIGYHMLMGLELGPLFTRLFLERKIHLRGIAHPFMFDRASELLMPDSSSFDSHRLLGAVPASAANFYKLLSRKSFVLLYPGGAREALHKKMLLDYDDLVNLPFYDILDKRINQDAVRLRTESTGEVRNQALYLPILLPKIPGRLYFLFGRPIEMRGRREELKDKYKAQQLYMHVKSEVKNCITYLKEKREKDPYRNILPRLLYQLANGYTAEVPTFEL